MPGQDTKSFAHVLPKNFYCNASLPPLRAYTSPRRACFLHGLVADAGYSSATEPSNNRMLMDEDATCVLYQQLIRSKDTPGSLIDAAANRQASAATTRRPASSRDVDVATRSPRQVTQSSSQMNNVPNKAPSSSHVVPPLPRMPDDSMPRSSAASPSPRRSRLVNSLYLLVISCCLHLYMHQQLPGHILVVCVQCTACT